MLEQVEETKLEQWSTMLEFELVVKMELAVVLEWVDEMKLAQWSTMLEIELAVEMKLAALWAPW